MPTLQLAPKLSIHYTDTGGSEKPAVLLLHGLGATCESWQLQIHPLMESGFRVIAPDARGFGRSTYPGGGISISRMAGDMAQLLDHLQVERAAVVGISMGGTLALQLALDRPDLVGRLALVNTFACLRPERLEVWLYFALRFVLIHTLGLPVQAQAVASRIFPAPEQAELRRILIGQIQQADPGGYRATMRALARFDVRPRLNEIGVPVLVVTAREDTTVPPKNQALLAQRIPGARQVFISGAGHAVTVEQPGSFNSALFDFLRT